jgi:hypothetical protein
MIPETCPQCREEIPADAPMRLCPRCLFDPTPHTTERPSAPEQAPQSAIQIRRPR